MNKEKAPAGAFFMNQISVQKASAAGEWNLCSYSRGDEPEGYDAPAP